MTSTTGSAPSPARMSRGRPLCTPCSWTSSWGPVRSSTERSRTMSLTRSVDTSNRASCKASGGHWSRSWYKDVLFWECKKDLCVFVFLQLQEGWCGLRHEAHWDKHLRHPETPTCEGQAKSYCNGGTARKAQSTFPFRKSQTYRFQSVLTALCNPNQWSTELAFNQPCITT